MLKSLFIITLSGFFSFCYGQWNPNTFVNLQVADSLVSDIETVTTPDGKTWIAVYALNGATGNYDMRAQLLDVAGNKLLGSNGVLVSDEPSGSATFVFNVCMDINANLVIAFQYEVNGVLNAVVTKVNQDGSLPWGGGTILGAGLAPYPAVNSSNEVIVAWNNDSPSTLYMQKLNGNGVIQWASPVVVLVGTSNTTRGQIVTHDDGNFTMVFQRRSFGISTTLYAQRYNASGSPLWAAPVQLSNLTSAGVRYYSILNIGNVTYFGYYVSSGSRFSSYLQKINPNGTIPWGINGSPFSTYANPGDPIQQTTGIAYEPGSSSIWGVCTYSDPGQTQYGVYVQKFDTATGAVQLDPLGKVVYPISTNNDYYEGGLHVYNGGPVFMTYNANTDYKIYATRLNALGNFVWPGSRVELSSTAAPLGFPKSRYSFAGMVNGQAVAVWTEDRGSGERAYAQNITAAGPLPVTWMEFKGQNRNGEALLNWSTSSEFNNKGFDIESSRDGINFYKIGNVTSKGAGGNSDVVLHYNFTDKLPFSLQTYYRIRQTDFDGRCTYSNIISIRFEKQTGLSVKGMYPLPAANELNIPVESKSDASLIIYVSDMSGRLVKEQKRSLRMGESLIKMDVADMPGGTYSIKIVAEGRMVFMEKWMKL